ncbi:MAG: hypothetical protein CL840_06805 [Crocinitomicaceae bacterium]|nr:hypothetical protein [Crocinitomicaceae bacterium]|tara:strand:+ start:9338 stop:10207 length:870 start_codon:yes stop_codon:yes gene_type:complete
MVTKNTLIVVSLLLISTTLFGASSSKQINLNKGTLVTADSTKVPYYAFNKDTVFSQENERLLLTLGDTLLLTVYNRTSSAQRFVVQELAIDVSISGGASQLIKLTPAKAGVFVYSAVNTGNEINHYGAAGMLVVTAPKYSKLVTFYWNIKDFEYAKVLDLDSGKTVDWKTYYPDYFLVNGKGKDQLVGDLVSNPVGKVGDSLLIMMANTGKAVHSIHFHGYHAIVLESNTKRVQKGSNKDTFPLATGDGLMVLMVPDKPGIYPVHDHNLIAVSGGGKYPNGVFMILDIK